MITRNECFRWRLFSLLTQNAAMMMAFGLLLLVSVQLLIVQLKWHLLRNKKQNGSPNFEIRIFFWFYLFYKNTIADMTYQIYFI